jgi:fructuronate reductase
LKLNYNSLNDKNNFEGYSLPLFNIQQVIDNTKNNPEWLHFGAGNIFRAFPAVLSQTLLNDKLINTGIICCDVYDEEIIEKIFTPYDNLSIVVTLNSDGKKNKEIVASVTESLTIKLNKSRLFEIFANPHLQMSSFTITEKGYSISDTDDNFFNDILHDFENGPENTKHFMGLLTSLCLHRFNTCKTALALVSMDNCSHNGIMLYNSIMKIATKWKENKHVTSEFVDFLNNSITFPCSMIDKITPRPDSNVKDELISDGFENIEPIITNKKTYVAPFVNCEKPQYLVIEDLFPNGRPPLEKVGVIFTTRETVDMVEKMKVCTCLNPLHTALAIYGCLLGYTSIYKEMENNLLVKLLHKIGYTEGLPVVVDPLIISPKEFIKEVLELRLTNPYVPDTPQRIVTDTSQKLAIRFGETIKAYEASGTLKTESLEAIPLVFAGWLRYLLGKDDNGNAFDLSPDPMIYTLTYKLSTISIGYTGAVDKILKPILSDEKIFGVDLYKVGLGEKVERYFSKLIVDKGSVYETLTEILY